MPLIYIDESGDHAPAATNPEYPLFVIVACVFDEQEYTHRFVPRLLAFKLRHWGHDAVVLHEREIRKNQGDFAFLFDQKSRATFLSDLSVVVRGSGVHLAAAVWDKRKTMAARLTPSAWSSYSEGLMLGLPFRPIFNGLCSSHGETAKTKKSGSPSSAWSANPLGNLCLYESAATCRDFNLPTYVRVPLASRRFIPRGPTGLLTKQSPVFCGLIPASHPFG